MIFKVFTQGLAVVATAALSVACVVDSSSGSSYGSSYGGGSSGTPDTATPADVAPMLVEVDTGKTMNASPGEGVGVFIEYGAGGKWHVWWTCDTNQTRQACNFTVKLSAETGALANVQTEAFGSGDVLATVSQQQIMASTKTTTQVDGVTFETAAGGTIRLEASVSGLKDSGFIFFVQDGSVNGGYAGVLTNPLLLRGKTP